MLFDRQEGLPESVIERPWTGKDQSPTSGGKIRSSYFQQGALLCWRAAITL